MCRWLPSRPFSLHALAVSLVRGWRMFPFFFHDSGAELAYTELPISSEARRGLATRHFSPLGSSWSVESLKTLLESEAWQVPSHSGCLSGRVGSEWSHCNPTALVKPSNTVWRSNRYLLSVEQTSEQRMLTTHFRSFTEFLSCAKCWLRACFLAREHVWCLSVSLPVYWSKAWQTREQWNVCFIIKGETEDQKAQVTFPRPHSKYKWGLILRAGLQAC